MNNYNDYNPKNFNVNSENNLINIANTIDLENLNGTNIMDLNKETFNIMPKLNAAPNLPNVNNIPFNNMPNFNMPINNINTEPFNNTNMQTNINSNPQDKNLIKSITRELINNLKENNISLHDDNTTYQSKKYNNKIDNDYSNSYEKYESSEDNYDINNEKKKDNKKVDKNYKYKNEIKKKFETMMTETGIPVSESFSSYIFDDLFNLKEFIILFGVYFLLSQEMIKDLFAQYFTSLEPDETGKVHVKGVIIYGLILTILYMVLKKII
jgi:Fe2+ transport system protein B